MRTEPDDVHEGGVATGFGVLDLLLSESTTEPLHLPFPNAKISGIKVCTRCSLGIEHCPTM